MLKSIFAEVEASLEENKKASEPPVPNPRSEIKEERRERRRRRSSTSKIPHVVKSSRQEDNSAIEFMLDEFAQRGRFVNRHAEDKENEQVIPAVSETTAPDTRIRRKRKKVREEPKACLIRTVLDGPFEKETRKIQSLGGVPKTKTPAVAHEAIAPVKKKERPRSLPSRFDDITPSSLDLQHPFGLSSPLSPRASARRRRSKSLEIPQALIRNNDAKAKEPRRKKKRRSSLAKTVNFITENVLSRKKKKDEEEHLSHEEQSKAEAREKYADKVTCWRKTKQVLYHDGEGPDADSLPKREIKGGSMPALVSVLIEEGIDNDGVIKDIQVLAQFLLAYQQWISPEQLFDILIEGYFYGEIFEEDFNEENGETGGDNILKVLLRQKIAVFLITWLETCFESDFKEDAKLLERAGNLFDRIERDVLHFDKTNSKVPFPSRENIWLCQIIQAKENVTFESLASLASSEPTEPQKKPKAVRSTRSGSKDKSNDTNASSSVWMNPSLTRMCVRDFSPSLLALQITKRNFGIFKKIQPTEFHGLAFSKSEKADNAPHIVELTERWNHLSYAVASEVIDCTSLEIVVATICHCIKLAKVLLKLHNFHDAGAVYMGLSLHDVERLHVAWEHVPDKALKVFARLKMLFSPMNNYLCLRYEADKKWTKLGLPHYYETFIQENINNEVLLAASAREAETTSYGAGTAVGGMVTPRKKEKRPTYYPCIPAISVWTKDVASLQEGNLDYLEEAEREEEEEKEKEKEKETKKEKKSSKKKEKKKKKAKKRGPAKLKQPRMVNWDKLQLFGQLLLKMKDMQTQECLIEYDFAADCFLESGFCPYSAEHLDRKSLKLRDALNNEVSL